LYDVSQLLQESRQRKLTQPGLELSMDEYLPIQLKNADGMDVSIPVSIDSTQGTLSFSYTADTQRLDDANNFLPVSGIPQTLSTNSESPSAQFSFLTTHDTSLPTNSFARTSTQPLPLAADYQQWDYFTSQPTNQARPIITGSTTSTTTTSNTRPFSWPMHYVPKNMEESNPWYFNQALNPTFATFPGSATKSSDDIIITANGMPSSTTGGTRTTTAPSNVNMWPEFTGGSTRSFYPNMNIHDNARLAYPTTSTITSSSFSLESDSVSPKSDTFLQIKNTPVGFNSSSQAQLSLPFPSPISTPGMIENRGYFWGGSSWDAPTYSATPQPHGLQSGFIPSNNTHQSFNFVYGQQPRKSRDDDDLHDMCTDDDDDEEYEEMPMKNRSSGFRKRKPFGGAVFNPKAAEIKRCSNCGCFKTPRYISSLGTVLKLKLQLILQFLFCIKCSWRRGPDNVLLCNACGL
jgi:hypothetical protein